MKPCRGHPSVRGTATPAALTQPAFENRIASNIAKLPELWNRPQ
jgi:hypothetical protein